MSGSHPPLPPNPHPLGYTEPEVRRFLGTHWPEFKNWLRADLLSYDEQGQPRYWAGNLHHYMHQERLPIE